MTATQDTDVRIVGFCQNFWTCLVIYSSAPTVGSWWNGELLESHSMNCPSCHGNTKLKWPYAIEPDSVPITKGRKRRLSHQPTNLIWTCDWLLGHELHIITSDLRFISNLQQSARYKIRPSWPNDSITPLLLGWKFNRFSLFWWK